MGQLSTEQLRAAEEPTKNKINTPGWVEKIAEMHPNPLVRGVCRSLMESRADADRFRWFFTTIRAGGPFMQVYMKGMQEQWTIEQWQTAIDDYRSQPIPPVV